MANGSTPTRALHRRAGVDERGERYEVSGTREHIVGSGDVPVYMPSTAAGRRLPASAGLYDVVELILDRGLVIDAFVRVSLVGIELLTIDARVVIAGVDTYLRFAEVANRLDLRGNSDAMGLPEMFGADSHKARIGRNAAHARGAISRGARRAKEAVTGRKDDDQEDDGNKKRGEDWR